MTETSSMRARRRIREIFDRVIADGLRSEAVAGASEQQLREWAKSQAVSALPAAAAEVFGLVGVRQGPWWYGSTAAISQLDWELKELALDCLDSAAGLADSHRILVLLAHGGYEFHVVDGDDVYQDDPPVWRITQGDSIERHWSSVTTWFESAAISVQTMRERVQRIARKELHGHELALQEFFRI